MSQLGPWDVASCCAFFFDYVDLFCLCEMDDWDENLTGCSEMLGDRGWQTCVSV